MRVEKMTKKDFNNIPFRKWDEDIGKFSSLVIIPTRKKHDSGYMCMEFVAVDANHEPICKMSGCSDVIHIDGIGGYGNIRESGEIQKMIVPKGWSIDCLPCGYLRLFLDGKMTCGLDLSDFEVYREK